MVVNKKKSKVMVFHAAKKHDIYPQLTVGKQTLEIVEEAKILGYIFTSDMKTLTNTQNLVKKTYKKLWLIRRL